MCINLAIINSVFNLFAMLVYLTIATLLVDGQLSMDFALSKTQSDGMWTGRGAYELTIPINPEQTARRQLLFNIYFSKFSLNKKLMINR